MSSNSKIEWTDATWNPVRGCTKISPGCAHCYAEVFAERFRGVPGHPYAQGFDLRLAPERLLDPLKWSKQKMVFVNSMSDLFHEGVSDDFIVRVAQVMAKADWHIYQVLTKRADRLCRLLEDKLKFASRLPHIWWGVSVENRRHGLPRVAELRRSGALTRFLSIEPLLEDLGDALDLAGLAWVIVGGESGHRARPMDVAWVRSIQQKCRQQEVPFFFKQWGGVRKHVRGRMLDGQTFDEFPPIHRQPAPDATTRKRLAELFETAIPAMA